MGLFDTTVPSTNPSDAEAFKLGASRIRSLQDTLQTMLGQIFATTTTYIPGWLTAAALATGLITQDKLADGILTADAAGRLKMADGFLTFAKLDSAMRFTTSEKSVSVTALSVLTDEAHGLGALPKFTRWVLRCKTAEFGYSIGDEIDVGSIYNASNSNSSAFAFGVTATNIFCYQRVGSTNIGFTKRASTAGANCTLTAASWVAVGYAQV